MGLQTYRRKRDFERTPEPRGGRVVKPRGALSFVIQKHAARRLHHDFRLELDGVLLSWAVPKGPPTRPGGKALAVRTEDHPLEYGGFEGVIPAGQYGGGTVMLWDRGTWLPDGDPHADLQRGSLDFHLAGDRLIGRWTLTRMDGTDDDNENWLLIKRSDRGGSTRSSPPELDESVASGRTMAEIAAHGEREWTAGGERRREPHERVGVDASNVPAARSAEQPRALKPQLAELGTRAPDGDDWLHELKFDGYRLIAVREADQVRLLTRNGQDWTERFPTVARAIAQLPIERAILDGEVVVLKKNGATDFQALQNSLSGATRHAHVYFAFDLPHCGGFDLTNSPLIERKALLERLLAAAEDRRTLRYSSHVVGHGPEFVRNACDLALEGAISKRADARYESRRAKSWVKTKCIKRQEFVVGGMTAPAGSRERFGALLLGVHGDDGRLRFAGRVGTGFTRRSLSEVEAALAPLEIDEPPFVDPPTGADARGVRWVRPERVVEVTFTEWTSDGILRHPSFQGLREDKPAREVQRERPTAGDGPAAARGGSTFAGVRLTHPDRVLYPEQAITKRDLAAYYTAIADHVLPHLVDRPLTLVRCPRGHEEKCFYQKHVTQSIAPPVRTVEVPEKDGVRGYVGIDDLGGLITLVQLGVLELHPWGARADRLDRPDRIVFDLDPGPGVVWARVVEAALRVRELLDALGLQSFARTTGGKGLHVVLPIERRASWPDAKEFSRRVAERIAAADRGSYVLTASKAARQDRIFLDYLRNDRGSTAVASYSSRARPGAPVATPLRWDEVTPELDPQRLTIATVPERLANGDDAWAGFFDLRQSLTSEMRAAVAG